MMFTTTNLEKQIRKLREAINYRDWQLDRLNVAIKQKDEEIEHLNNVVKVKEQQADSLSHMLEDKKTEITMLNKENKDVERLNLIVKLRDEQIESFSHKIQDKVEEIARLRKENKELKESIKCLSSFDNLLAVSKFNEAIKTVFDDDEDEDLYANDKCEEEDEEDEVGVLDKMRSIIEATIDAMGELKDQLEELEL